MSKAVISIYPIAEKVLYLCGSQKVILDRDLTRLYGVLTRVLNQAVKRNSGRFPSDFAFILSRAEIEKDITVRDILFDPKIFEARACIYRTRCDHAFARKMR
jgi:hypothetical protein